MVIKVGINNGAVTKNVAVSGEQTVVKKLTVGNSDAKVVRLPEGDTVTAGVGSQTIIKSVTVGRPIRLATPNMCKPFYKGKVVGVGESIGTVYPLLGEGIIPSMECVNIFVKNLGDNEAYEREVLEHYKIYGKVFNFVRNKMKNKFSMIKQISELLSIFRYMKKNEDRFGMEIHMKDLMKVAKA